MKDLFVAGFVALALNGAAAAQASSPGYDCKKATADVEAFICEDEELASFDRDLSAAYHKYIDTLSPDEKARLKKGGSRVDQGSEHAM